MSRVIVGADEVTDGATAVVAWLRAAGHEVAVVGPLIGGDDDWVTLGQTIGRAVADGDAAWGAALCWTGTGIAIAANKVSGVRAALCADAQTASGARRWNDANVLCFSLRTLTPALAAEILTAWTAPVGRTDEEAGQIARLES